MFPAPFQQLLCQWEDSGSRISDVCWTGSGRRHACARVVTRRQKICFAKLAVADQPDWDEENMVDGLRREVGFSRVVTSLRGQQTNFPFAVPSVVATNCEGERLPHGNQTAWALFEFIDAKPIESPTVLAETVASAVIALEQITPRTIRDLGLPDVFGVIPPHGSRRWLKKGLLDPGNAVLGHGSLEAKHFLMNADGQAYLVDAEFAGWYPRYDELTYAYHRLACNDMRLPVAQHMLRSYIGCSLSIRALDDFFADFSRIMWRRLFAGMWYDTVRRNVKPWDRKQWRRVWLLRKLMNRAYADLTS